ncbi:unnamed protein product [Rhizophagus irregularis]|nr:unnamed protein product [Rhizophagus irregularis]
MAYTKIFLGDLPEIINEIIQYFQNDFSTLHSCILVNRIWCRLAIPLLWENPFSLRYPKNYRYIEVYLHNLNDYDRSQLNEYGISNDSFLSNTLFNYPSFTQHLDTRKISDSIEKWVATVRISTVKEQFSNIFVRENVDQKSLKYTKMIYRSLFRLFIEKEADINTLEVTMLIDNDLEYFNDTFELILQNPNFIRNIRNLTLDFDPANDNITKFMIFLYSNCNSISSLYFLFPWYYYTTTEKHLSQIIDSQQNLKKISLCFNDLPLYHSLLSLKNPNFELSLNYLAIESHYDDKLGSIVLKNLGQILPTKLEYLSLSLEINTNDFEIFLKNSQDIFIKKLLIKNIRNGKREESEKKNILPYIKEYIMKKKRIKYFAFLEYFFIQTPIENDDLFSLKDEVKEFRLHNIIVQNYYDLNIEVREFINEMY